MILTIKLVIKKIKIFKLISICLSFIWYSNLFSQSQDNALWIEDIDTYKSNLEKLHIDLYNTISADAFENEITKIKSELDKKTETEIIIDLMRLTQKIGDGHTALSMRNLETHLFPIEIYPVNDEWRVIKATKTHKALLGKILTAIDGIPMTEIASTISEVTQYVENDQSKCFRISQYAMISELLFGMQLTQNKFKAEFAFQDLTTTSLEAISNTVYYNMEFESIETQIPGVKKPTNTIHDYLWFSPIENTKAIYLKFESYPSFEGMEVFGTALLKYINNNKSRQVVIDLRNNGGGDFYVGTLLAYYLNLADSIDWKSGVYVLTDKVTFSAATSNATQFKQMLNAKIIGEPTGSNPSGYQDMGEFILPNSKLIITYSKRLFRFQETFNIGLQPDVLIKYNWDDYVKGEDNMMTWILNDIHKH